MQLDQSPDIPQLEETAVGHDASEHTPMGKHCSNTNIGNLSNSHEDSKYDQLQTEVQTVEKDKTKKRIKKLKPQSKEMDEIEEPQIESEPTSVPQLVEVVKHTSEPETQVQPREPDVVHIIPHSVERDTTIQETTTTEVSPHIFFLTRFSFCLQIWQI